jgi:hypothetical protein
MAMATDGISISADVTSSLLPAGTVAYPAPQGTESAPQTPAELADKGKATGPVDTVELSNKAQESTKEQLVKKEATPQPKRQESGKVGEILFVYNLKGDLRVRFMDSSNRLIYQMPPVLFARTMDLMQSFRPMNIKA